MSELRLLRNYVDGTWLAARAEDYLDVINPATAQPLARVPLSASEDVNRVVQAAAKAFPGWRSTPATARIQHLFQLKNLLEEHLDEIARTITSECGKTYNESVGEMRRGIENVEVACGIPILMQGYNSEDIARGIDELMIRQPLGRLSPA